MSLLMLVSLVTGIVVAVLVPLLFLQRELKRQHRERLAAMFVTGLVPVVARSDPQELIAWSGAIGMARAMYPEIVENLDAASGGQFPFTSELIEKAHSKWTTEWLSWERKHDTEFKERTREVLAHSGSFGDSMSQGDRAKLDSIEDDKLQSYQRKYEEYIRIGNALSALSAKGPNKEGHE